jgi:hypothetical protein
MIIHELNDNTWLFFAIKNYNNPTSVTYADFEEDLKRFKYIKRLFNRYEITGELKTHLILNHIIILYNTFNDAATPLLFFKIDSKYWAILKAFMQYLNRLPLGTLDNVIVDDTCLKTLKLL